MPEAKYQYTISARGVVSVWSPFIDPERGPMVYAEDEREARAMCDKLNAIKDALGEILREAEATTSKEYAQGLGRAVQLIEMEVCENA